MDVTKLKVPELKKELKLRALNTSGNKNELVERLLLAMKSSADFEPDSIGDELDEDLLNDEFDDHTENESVLESDLEKALEESPKPKIAEQPKEAKKYSVPHELNDDSSKPKKKIKLIREAPPIEESNGVPSPEKKEESEDKKVVKLSELSAKERLDLRAKKFGVTDLSVDAKKTARAERFGNGAAKSNSITENQPKPTMDVLKQRAERFGGSVSSVMTGLDNEEKLEKRKARFGMK